MVLARSHCRFSPRLGDAEGAHELQGIRSRGAQRSIVENTPSALSLMPFNTLCERSDDLWTIGRIVHARRSVPAKVRKAPPASWLTRQGMKGRVGRDPSNLETGKKTVGGRCKPALVARLASDPKIGLAPPNAPEEGFRESRIEWQAWRQLHQEHPEL